MNGQLLDMTIALAPEIILVAGGCALLVIFSGGKPARSRQGAAWFALFTVIASAVTLMAVPDREVPPDPAILLSPIALSARWAVLLVGVLLVAANGLLPEDRPGEDPAARAAPEFFLMLLASLAGLMLTVSANDLIVLLLALELTSVPTYVAVALSRPQAKATEAGGKYFFLGALSAGLLLMGLAWLYGAAGTTRLSEFAPLSAGHLPVVVLVAFGLILAGLAFKIAAFPFHVYIADVYEGSAAPLAGWLAFVPKAAGLIALGKLLSAAGGPVETIGDHLVGWTSLPAFKWSIWALAAATMTAGNALALWQGSVKRLLAYSSVAHSGYLLVALLVPPAPGEPVAAVLLFYLVAYGIANLGAFLVLSAIRRPDPPGDREAETFADLQGLSARSPALAVAMAVFGFSLMGLPLTMGFVGKLYVFTTAIRSNLVVLVIVALLNAAVGAAYYLRMIAACWLSDGSVAPEPSPEVLPERAGPSPGRQNAPPARGVIIAILACATLLFGLAPSAIYRDLENPPPHLEASQHASSPASPDAPAPGE